MKLINLQTSLHKLNSLYLKQLGIYNNILKLSQEQLVLSDNEANQEALLEKINTRLNLINTIEKTNPEINLLKSELLSTLNLKEFNMTSIRAKLNYPVVDELEVTLKEIGNTLKQINQLDDEFKYKFQSLVPIPKPEIKPNMHTAQNAYKVFSQPKDKL